MRTPLILASVSTRPLVDGLVLVRLQRRVVGLRESRSLRTLHRRQRGTRLEHPALEEFLGQLPQEAARLVHDDDAETVERRERVDEEELVLRAGRRDVEKAPLLFRALGSPRRPDVREAILDEPDDEDGAPFESLR